MAHGACDHCGCAFEEHECDGTPVNTRLERARRALANPQKEKPKTQLGRDDWVRVRKGHRLAGAAGQVKHVDRSVVPALVRVRQLNGNELRLPLGLFEFVSYSNVEPDVL